MSLRVGYKTDKSLINIFVSTSNSIAVSQDIYLPPVISGLDSLTFLLPHCGPCDNQGRPKASPATQNASQKSLGGTKISKLGGTKFTFLF